MKKINKQIQKRRPSRVIIQKVRPEIDGGKFPIKRIVGETVIVKANIFADGHEEVVAKLLYRTKDEKQWHEVYMTSTGNDGWVGSFSITEEKEYFYSLKGYVCEFATWLHDLQKRIAAQQNISIDIKIGLEIIEKLAESAKDKSVLAELNGYLQNIRNAKNIDEAISLIENEELLGLMQDNTEESRSFKYEKDLIVNVERKLAAFSSWYELFPRSWSQTPGKHGTFKDCKKLLPEISKMGFDIIYFPPIHPIGVTHRKGKNNSVKCEDEDPGCPWAIGSEKGGHKSVHPNLGTTEELTSLIKEARSFNLEIALDLAFQCSPDHPYVKEHPQWFKWRPDGTVQFAENPPKKYEDILPINFETEDWENLWEELKSIVLFWIEAGVKVFRVDNPHTKPFLFWDWLISEVREIYPDVIFLSEAFSRPHIMFRLAKGGFTQSYTYFTWRYTKKDFVSYLTELTQTETAEYFRPNFWPNTPDILSTDLQKAPREAFIKRAVLAATLSSNYGIYGPVFELCISKPFPGKEEYDESEKYEIKIWDWDRPENIKDVLTKLNKIRKENPAFQTTRNIRFCDIDNENILAFYKSCENQKNHIIVVINLDIQNKQSGWLTVPIEKIGLNPKSEYFVEDLFNGNSYPWRSGSNFIELDPQKLVAHIFKIKEK